MTPTDRELLRSIAYGPDASAEERSAAERSLRQLDKEQHAAEFVSVDEFAAGAESSQDSEAEDFLDEGDDSDSDEEPDEVAFWQRTVRVAWLIPIVVASIAVGYVASISTIAPLSPLKSASGTEAGDSPPDGVDFTDGTLILGDLRAADAWFDRPASSEETFPLPMMLEPAGVSSSDIRLAIHGGDRGSVWVARTDSELCLFIAIPVDGTGANTCVERAHFERWGITLGSNGLEARWYGRDVITSPALVDAVAESPNLELRPGNVAAANAALNSQETPLQNLVIESGGPSLGVDLVGAFVFVPDNAPWMTVLIAKQNTGGFCMIVSEDGGVTNQAMCATVDEFQKHGLSFALAHYVFQWDGMSTTVSRIP